MTCSNCGQTGHNAKTCPNITSVKNNSNKKDDEYAVWMRCGGMNKQQATEFQRRSEDLLDEIAPDADGVSAKAKASELPKRIREAMAKKDKSDNKKLES